MKYSIPGLGGRLQRARRLTGMSKKKVAEEFGVSWMTVHRWQRSQRGIPDTLLDRVSELYSQPLRWFLTLEEDDLVEETGPVERESGKLRSAAADRLCRKIAGAPATHRPMIEKVVEDLIDGLRRGG